MVIRRLDRAKEPMNIGTLFKRVYKKLIGYREIFFIREKNLPQKPYEVLIEVTNICNLRCPMCYTYKSARKKGYMSLALYKNAIKQVVNFGVSNVHLYTVGEPLLHRDIIDMVKIAKNHGRKVFIYTNGLLLNKNMAKGLVDEKIDNIVFSIEGITKEKYENIRRGSSFDTVKENIRILKEYRDAIGSKANIEIWSTIMDEDSKYLSSFKDFWGRYADRIYFVHLANQGGYIKNILGKCEKSLDASIRQPCGTLWNSLIILWNGDVSACCVDFNGEMILANISENSLQKIWNGRKHKMLQKLHLKKRFHQLFPCNICDAGLVNTYRQQKSLNEEYANTLPRTLHMVQYEKNTVN